MKDSKSKQSAFFTVFDTMESQNYWLQVSNACFPTPKVTKDFLIEFAHWYRRIVNQATGYIFEWENHFGIRNSCCLGCSCCCFQMIEVYNYELLPILAYIQMNNLEYLLNDVDRVASLLEQQLPKKALKKGGHDNNMDIKSKMVYRTLEIPCLFLKNGKCAIYPVRPSCCATYYSYGDIKECSKTDRLPANCYNHQQMEDWIFGQVTAYLHYNKYSIPNSFDLFKINILPIAIRDYLNCEIK